MDAIAFRTRARFKEPASQACDKKLQAATLISQRSRRRLRRTVASESQHEHLNNNNSPAPTSDDEQNDSVASNEIRSPDGGGQGKPAGSRNRRRCVVSPPTTSASSDDSDVVIVGEFQSNDRDGAASQQQAKRPCIRQPSPKIAVNKPPLSDKPEDGDDLESDEELRIVGMVGQVVTRDLAHPRPHCAEHHFDRDMAAVESNAKCCEQCYCFVCDVKASECQFWGTGRRQRDHANARPHPGWNALRQAARAGDKALVRREFEGEGPLLSLPQVAAAATIPREMYSQQELRQLLQQQQQTAALLLSRLMQQQQSGAQRQRALETGRGGGGGGGGAMEIAATADLDFGSHVDAFLAMLSFGRPGTAAADAGDVWARNAAAVRAAGARSDSGRPAVGRGQQEPPAAGDGGSGAARPRGSLTPSHIGAAAAAAATSPGATLPGAASPSDPQQARQHMQSIASADVLQASTARGQQPRTSLGGGAAAAAALAASSRAAAAAQPQPYNPLITQQSRGSQHATDQDRPRCVVLNPYVPQQQTAHHTFAAQQQLQPQQLQQQQSSCAAVLGVGVSPHAPLLLLPPHLPTYQQNQNFLQQQLQLQNQQLRFHLSAETAAVQTQAEQTRKAQTQTRPHFQTHMSDIRTQMGIMMQPPQPQPSSSFPYRQPPWMVTGQNPGAADISGRLRQVAAATASAAAAAAGAGGGGGGGLMLQNLQKNAVNGPIVGTMAGTAAAAAAATPPSASVPVPICLQHVPELPWTAVNLSPSTSPQGPLRSHPPAPV